MTRHYENMSATVDSQGRSRWVQPVSRGYRLACCDCGLVHAMDSRVRDGAVQVRFARDNRATGAKRRAKAPTDVPTFLRFAARSLVALYAKQPEELDGFVRRLRAEVRKERGR